MLIIKPYGRTNTQLNESTQQAKRQWLRKNHPTELEKLQEEPSFVISHWISCIDKIIAKPGKSGKVSDVQYQARQFLGEAVWACIAERHPTWKQHEKAWQHKLHPYKKPNQGRTKAAKTGKTSEQPTGKKVPPANLQGRWYASFVGSMEPKDINPANAQTIAQKIASHLYEQATTIQGDKQHKKGLMPHKLAAIRQNVRLPLPTRLIDSSETCQTPLRTKFTDLSKACQEAARTAYFQAGEVIASIHQTIHSKSYTKDSPKPTQVIFGQLYEHYGKLFGSNTANATLQNPEHPQHTAYLLHQAIKETYEALYSHVSPARKAKMALGEEERTSVDADPVKLQVKPANLWCLPQNQDAMLELIHKRHTNSQLARLVRQGKVLHYQAIQLRDEKGKGKITNSEHWAGLKSQFEGSAFWLSQGQAEIKRNEALVRVFKLAISKAAHSLVLLTGIEQEDIFVGKGKEEAMGAMRKTPQLAQECFKLYFSASESPADETHHAFLTPSPEELTDLVTDLIGAWSKLRNASFHFKGLSKFIQELSKDTQDSKLNSFATQLWEHDLIKSSERVLDNLRALECQKYLTQAQLEQFISTLYKYRANPQPGVDLPKLSRLMKRAKNTEKTWGAEPNQKDSAKDTAENVKFVLLKLLYESAFLTYLEDKDSKSLKEIGKWVSQAIQRTTQAAQTINQKPGTPEDLIISSKAQKLLDKFAPKDSTYSLKTFFAELFAETATEFRVQNHYQSDSKQAQKQAQYLDNLKQDILLIAFEKFLDTKVDTKDFTWLKAELQVQASEAKLPEQLHPNLLKQCLENCKDWQKRWYAMLHLVPVGTVSLLSQQLRKFEVLSTASHTTGNSPTQIPPIQKIEFLPDVFKVFNLYFDMQDAQFSGVGTLHIDKNQRVFVKKCFAKEETFHKIFRKSGTQPASREKFVPIRGIREMLRFGTAQVLTKIFHQQPIRVDEFDAWDKFQTKEVASELTLIAKMQGELKQLHEEWVAHPEKFTSTQEYQEKLKKVSNYRELQSRVHFIDHLRLHDLMLSVLARLVDYAGLWERDLYFVTLSLVYDHNYDWQTLFKPKDRPKDGKDCLHDGKTKPKHGKDYLHDGQMVEAIDCIDSKSFHQAFQRFFVDYSSKITIRNHLSHFSMLRNSETIKLTDYVNDTRQLMSYDRKLKNAVSQSIIELCDRQGLILSWKMNGNHQLGKASVQSKKIKHLKGKGNIFEDLHSESYVQMVQALFNGVNEIQEPCVA